MSRTFPIDDETMTARVKCVQDKRGRILSGYLLVKNVEYSEGLEVIAVDVPIRGSKEHMATQPPSIHDALSSFYNGQLEMAFSIKSHLITICDDATKSSSSSPSVSTHDNSGSGYNVGRTFSSNHNPDPTPEAMDLLAQIVRVESSDVRTVALDCLEILANSNISEHRRFLFRNTIVGFAVGSLHDIFRTTKNEQVAIRCLSILENHLISHISLHTIQPIDMLTQGIHSKASVLLADDTSRAKLNRNILRRNQESSNGGGDKGMSLQIDMDVLENDVEEALIRFTTPHTQGILIEVGQRMIAIAAEAGLIKDLLDKQSSPIDAPDVPEADWTQGLGLGGKKRVGNDANTASAPVLVTKSKVSHHSSKLKQHGKKKKLSEYIERLDDYDEDNDEENIVTRDNRRKSSNPISKVISKSKSKSDYSGDSNSDQDTFDEGPLKSSISNDSLAPSDVSDLNEIGLEGENSDSDRDQSARSSHVSSRSSYSKDIDGEDESDLRALRNRRRDSNRKGGNDGGKKPVKSRNHRQSKGDIHRKSSMGPSGDREQGEEGERYYDDDAFSDGDDDDGDDYYDEEENLGAIRRRLQPALSMPILSPSKRVNPIDRPRMRPFVPDILQPALKSLQEAENDMITIEEKMEQEEELELLMGSPRTEALRDQAARILSIPMPTTVTRVNPLPSSSQSTDLLSSLQDKRDRASKSKGIEQERISAPILNNDSIPFTRIKALMLSGDSRSIEFGLDKFTKQLLFGVGMGKSIWDDSIGCRSPREVFEISVILLACLRTSLSTPKGPAPSFDPSMPRAEVVARRVLQHPDTDLKRAHQCIVCLRLLLSYKLQIKGQSGNLLAAKSNVSLASRASGVCTIFSNVYPRIQSGSEGIGESAVVAAMHTPTPVEVLKAFPILTDSATSRRQPLPIKLILTLAHPSEMGFEWHSASVADAGASNSTVADGCAELAAVAIRRAGWGGATLGLIPGLSQNTQVNPADKLSLETAAIFKFLKSEDGREFSPRLYLSLKMLSEILHTNGPRCEEYLKLMLANDFCVPGWLMHWASEGCERLICLSDDTWESAASRWVETHGHAHDHHNDPEFHQHHSVKLENNNRKGK